MDKLFLTEAEGTVQGFGYRYPSRFIFDVEKRLLNYEVEVPPHLVKNTIRYIEDKDAVLAKITNLSGLKINERVSHGILGNGTIIEIDETKHVYTVRFDKIPTPRKMSFKAPLVSLQK